jgi:plastocyanin
MKYTRVLAILALVSVLGWICIAAHAASPTPATKYPDSAYVNIKGGAFTPDNVTIAKGGYIIWTNTDDTPSSLKFDGYEKKLGKGDALTRLYPNVGTYAYENGVSPKHKGTVIVK